MNAARVVGLVLAAGASTRMGAGRNKLLEEVDGKPLVVWPVDALREAGVEAVFAVTGHEAARVEAVLDGAARPLRFDGWAEGMGASLAFGVRALSRRVEWDGLIVCLGDLPRVRAGVVRRVVDAFVGAAEESGAAGLDRVCVPTVDGRDGHPVLFGSAHRPALEALEGDRGARTVIEAAGSRVLRIEVADTSILRDVDTPEDLAVIRE